MIKYLTTALFFVLQFMQAQETTLEGVVETKNSEPISFANIIVIGSSVGTSADVNGEFKLNNVPTGTQTIRVSVVGFATLEKELTIKEGKNNIIFVLNQDTELEQVEVFGDRYKHPDKIEALTRLPLAPYEQIQSISIISEKVIEQQGNLTISDATKNVPGVYTFATYGNRRESMSSRGFRGIPILKNGVRVNSDFRGVGILTDMQGVDNIQVLKGSAAITQGVATDLGSPGGVINIVTKTPKYEFGGNASMRIGSFGQVRPTFDVYGPINEKKTLAFRVNGALERADSYRKGISYERFYINPSLQWKITPKTTVTAEMDYLDDSRTPDPGTVNLAGNDVNAIYDLPYDRFTGYDTDRVSTLNSNYSFRIDHELSDKLTLKGAFYKSDLSTDDKAGFYNSTIKDDEGNPIYNQKSRYYEVGRRNDVNSVTQFDLVGDDVKTGTISHTFQVGFDYRKTKFDTYYTWTRAVDTIDVFKSISNTLPDNIEFVKTSTSGATSRSIGFVAQDVISFNAWLKTFLGFRYSTTETLSQSETTRSDAFNPLFGFIVTPYKNINVFASYTNSTYPRSANSLDQNGNTLGNERFDQFETGIKTNWLNNRLRFNFTFFKINNKNINFPAVDATGNDLGYYVKGGNDERKGVEIELSGRIFENFEVITGYSYIDAQYKEHSLFVEGSAPINTPDHTFNIYGNYHFKHQLEGLSLGAGIYYTGERPINDWAIRPGVHQGTPERPFEVEAYTLVNMQAAYKINNHWGVRLLLNNVFNEIGYNAYRTNYINQTDPINFAGVLSYSF